ncbi:recombination-associated protein RdgC [Alloalcanivorax profundimaris]|uniref:recombination-associated protein RdgC n=1 Tax=Alloalcanivorax profundimaris TaxID=2735259 RepID=UPI001887FFBD|nr:recombination-associated protein RdgC [Alloalcanivorax profundimaris]MBF1801919.1 recombination-associated protein RdgC [Alloalcanivorax profundimaris]
MWIKNLTVFLGSETFDWSAAELEERLDAHRCPPCGRQSPSSEGFVPPLKNEDRMVVAAGSYFYVVHQEITRLLPGPVVKEELDARVEEIRDREGRPVGRKERSELKDQITFELLPQAFTRSRRTGVLIDPQRRRVMVDCGSESRSEQVVSALRKALDSLPVTRPTAPSATTAAFAGWLRDPRGLPDGFTLGDRCEFKNGDGASVRITALDLGRDEILAHLEELAAVKVNLAWKDEIEFDLQQDFAIKRLKPLDLIQENLDGINAEDALDEMMARLELQGGTLRAVLDALYNYFEVKAESGPGAD